MNFLSEFLAFVHFPLAAYLMYKAYVALRYAASKKDKRRIDAILIIEGLVIVARLTDYSPIAMEGEVYTSAWRSMMALQMVAVALLLNWQLESIREKKA